MQDLPGEGIKNGTSVEVEDWDQDLSVTLSVFHKTFNEEEVRQSHHIYFFSCSLFLPPRILSRLLRVSGSF